MRMKRDRFTTLVPEEARRAADALDSAFTWSESKEGHAYWRSIHNRLLEIAATPKSEYQKAREAADRNKPSPMARDAAKLDEVGR